jgi:hypothetical protein
MLVWYVDEGARVGLPGRDDAARRFAMLELGDEVVALCEISC